MELKQLSHLGYHERIHTTMMCMETADSEPDLIIPDLEPPHSENNTNIYGLNEHAEDQKFVHLIKTEPLYENAEGLEPIQQIKNEISHDRNDSDTGSQEQSSDSNFEATQDLNQKHTPDFVVCATCGRNFKSRCHLKMHEVSHEEKRPFSCLICGMQFKRRGHLVYHERIHTDMLYMGKPDSEANRITDDLKPTHTEHVNASEMSEDTEHSQLIKSEVPDVINDCGIDSWGQPSISNPKEALFKPLRIKETSQKPPFKVVLNKTDSANFDIPSQTIDSGSSGSTSPPYPCKTCGKEFNLRAHLVCHQRSHTGKCLFKCDICNKVFRVKQYLKKHFKTHTRKSVVCATCGKSFKSHCNLKMHEMSHEDKRPFACRICGTRFKRLQHLGYHEKSHVRMMNSLGLNRIIANLKPACLENNSNISELNENTEEPECSQLTKINVSGLSNNCDRGSQEPPSTSNPKGKQSKPVRVKETVEKPEPEIVLNEVDLIHFDAPLKITRFGSPVPQGPPYACRTCGRRFQQHVHLVRHEPVHAETGPFVCDVCNKVFVQKRHLKRHLQLIRHELTDAEKRSFKCDICTKAFTLEHHLKQHVNYVHHQQR